MSGENTGAVRKPRSGSETRQKTRLKVFRVTEEFDRKMEAASAAAGLTSSEYIRERLGIPSTILPKQKPEDRILLAKLLAELNKTGSNIAQVLKHTNFGNFVAREEYVEALGAYRDMRQAVLEVMHRRGRG